LISKTGVSSKSEMGGTTAGDVPKKTQRRTTRAIVAMLVVKRGDAGW
jgi:hypothetical protein